MKKQTPTTAQTLIKLSKLYALLFLVFFIVLLSNGRSKYTAAQIECINGEGSDQAIENTLYKHGFNLAWHEEPGIIDYLKANFN